MDSENEKKLGEKSAEQNAGGREGYQSSNQSNGYQGYRGAGRSPRPRIPSSRPYSSSERNGYDKSSNSEGGFRPDGFGGGLHSTNGASQQRPGGYRPRYNNNEGGYQPRGGYGNSRNGGYDSTRGGYGNNRPGGYGNNRPGGYGNSNNEAGYGSNNSETGYGNNRGGYGNNRPGGYGNNRPGGYGNNRPGGYGNNRPGGYGNNRPGGYGNNRPGGYRQHSADYDPNAKYSLKKRIEYKEENYDPNEPIRLNKFLANAGVCSRREADEFIQAGVVTVNGNVVTELGSKVLRSDEVKFHDQPVNIEKKVYVLLNKPKDYVTTSDDPQQRKTVMDLVKNACKERIYPVGRLDRNTTGVLLLTNDGDMASKLTHPKFLKKKIYHVYLDKNVTAHDLQQIRDGITLEDGEIKADAVEYADAVDKKQVGIEIHSGKNRIVRRIFESLGYKVTKLDRVQFAGLTKKNLRRGDWRYLTEEEVDRLRMGAYE